MLPKLPIAEDPFSCYKFTSLNDRKAGAFGAFIFNKETKNKKDKSW